MRNHSRTDEVRRGQRTKHVIDVLPLKIKRRPGTQTSTVLMHWGVASITARADVYAMMMGSLTDDQIRQPRLNR